MTGTNKIVLMAVLLWAAAGCGGNGGPADVGGDTANDLVATDNGADNGADNGPNLDVREDADAAIDVPDGDTAGDTATDIGDTGPVAECDKPANAAHRQELLDAQPSIEVRSKTILTKTIEFASLAGDSSVTCSVDLQFRDSNGNLAIDPYEDWTLTPAQRADDLLGRMTDVQKTGLMAHAVTSDAPTASNSAVSTALSNLIDENVRYAQVLTVKGQLGARATWANNVQEKCEASALGIPFVLSTSPVHSDGNGRTKAAGFSKWPHEFGLGATASTDIIKTFGEVVAQEYKAIGIRMALSPSADLATEPRWYLSQFTFGEDSAAVTQRVAAYIEGVQGETFGRGSVAAAVSSFPGAGPSKDGWDTRLAKGKYLTYPGNNIDAHLAPFAGAIDADVAAVMLSYGIPETGSWTGLGDVLDGATIEQVGVPFNEAVVKDALRGHYAFDGLVIAPAGVLDNAGAPWGVESLTPAQRVAKAVNAGVDQFAGISDLTSIADARADSLITGDQLNAAARRALIPIFAMGLFEDPYVDPAQAPAQCNTDASYRAGLNAMNQSMVLILNDDKPAGWLNGAGDGTQTGDKGNAGNGSGKVMPAPPGEPYVSAGCSYYIMGSFDLDYIRSVSTGYGEMTNDATSIDGVTVSTPAEKIPLTDYIFIRIPAPYTADPDSGDLEYGIQSLQYDGNDNSGVLDDLAFARQSIDAESGSKSQIVVGIDAGRLSVLDEVLGYGVSAVYIEWSVTDKVFLDVAFGIVDSVGKLPACVPDSDAAAQTQEEDVAGDGQQTGMVEGFGLTTDSF